jgi:hypothetical protein
VSVPVVGDATAASEAVVLVREADVRFVVVELDGAPQAVLSQQQLESGGGAPLHELIEGAEPLIVLDDPLEQTDVGSVAALFGHAEASAAVVLRGTEIVGVVDVESVAAALPLDQIVRGKEKGLGGLYGNPAIPPRGFVCLTCASRRLPQGGFDAPLCPRDPSHGPMEPE